jgi:hypothetical protein
VRGEVVRTYIREVHTRSSHYYCVDATYEYTVNGINYSHTWQRQSCPYSRSEAEARAYAAVGAQDDIYYDPTNPDRASNQRIGAEFLILIFGVAAIVLVLGLGFMWVAMDDQKEKRQVVYL